MERVVLREQRGRVRLVTLHRPARLNAFDNTLYNAMAAEFDDAAADEGVSVVVLTGSGRAFSAGADLSASEPVSWASFDRFLDGFSIGKPIIAAVNGVAVGIGVTMLLHCDLVVFDADARLRMPFTALGVAPEAGSSGLLPAVIGPQQAARLLYTSDWVAAAEAVSLGLGVETAPPGTSVDAAMRLAGRIAEFPLASLAATKRTLTAARAEVFRSARAVEAEVWTDLRLPPRA